MSVREALDYQASFRGHWNRDVEGSLLRQFQLDPAAPTSGLSKGQRTQLALIVGVEAAAFEEVEEDNRRGVLLVQGIDTTRTAMPASARESLPSTGTSAAVTRSSGTSPFSAC